MLEKASTTYASISITPFVLNSIYKYHELKEKGVYIREFIDISEKYFGKSYCDIPIHKNIDCKSDKYFVIPTRNHKAIKDRLLAAGVSEEKIVTLPPQRDGS